MEEGPENTMVEETVNPREELLETLHQEYDQADREIEELRSLIEQTDHEVERLQKKNSMVTNRLHQIESNFDSVPRQDIRVAYNEAMDLRNRLLTMRGNLEKLQGDEKRLSHMMGIISEVLSKVEGISPSSISAGNGSFDVNPAAASIIRIIEAQEHERQVLSQQLHDGPAQSLTNFILQAEICQRLFDRNPDRAAEELNNLKTVASATFQKVRDFIFDLRPMMLDDLGLIPTIRRYTKNYQNKSGIETTLHILGDERRLESHREVIMFRTIQTLLNNAREYAKATEVTVTLDMGVDTISCTVEDNGQAFNPELVFGDNDDPTIPANTKTLDLSTLRERLELIGGTMEAQSEEGEGSEIMGSLPAGNPPDV